MNLEVFMTKIKVFCIFTLTSLLLGAACSDTGGGIDAGLQSIEPMDVYNYCKTMASPTFAGRLTGHEGYTAAAQWAAAHFKQWKLQPISREEGYLQAYASPYTLIDSAKMSLLLPDKKGAAAGLKEIVLKGEQDFLPMLFSDNGDRTADLVFVGWGINAPELGYDDYAGQDVKGKYVLSFRGTPDPKDTRFMQHDQHRTRMQTAKDKGALGLFYIYPSPIANPNGDWIEGFTPAKISESVADKIFQEKNLTASDVKRSLLKTKKPASFALRAQIRYQVQSHHFPEGTGYNVTAYVEGSDPELKAECIVVGGHFDHCGQHMGFLFPGANDNASGSAVVMETAEAFSRLKHKPKRSVVFVLFGGEEMGLQGSTYFADHIPVPFTKVDSMLNFDMVGEGNGLRCSLSPEPESLKTILEEADEALHVLGPMRFFRGVGVRGSDFAPFYQKDIPCISFSSNGPHLSYHQSGDTIYRINPEIMADTARLAYLTAYKLAER